ncbi:MAG: SLBB domain-containing protein [Verrucomicrobiota bacterium]
MKLPQIALLLLLWMSAWLPSAVAQTELIPPMPGNGASAPSQAAPAPAPGPQNIDLLNDKVLLEKGDRLSYRIAEERAPSVIIVINDAGEVDVPLIGRIRAAGKTCKKLSEEIKPLLEKEYYYKATVIIGLETHSERSIGKFYVMGQVHVPGGYEIPAGETLSVSKAVARAQGFADFSDKENVRLIRKNEQGKNEMIIVNVAEVLDKGLVDKDMTVLPNDTVIVPEVKRFHTKVYVLGKVNVPTGLDLDEKEQITVTKAVARAQGFAEFADKEKVKLLRKNVVIPWFAVEDFVNPFAIANKILSSPDPLSRHLKTIFSPASLATLADPNATKQQQKFVLIDEFNKAIQGALIYDDQRFADISLSSDAKRLKAQNPKGDDLIRLNRLLLEDAYPRELRRNRPPEYQVFIVNVAEILDKGLVDKDPLMEGNDLVIVPESKRTHSKVSVMGQVHYPQTMEMEGGGNLTVSQVIAHAGGFADFANKRKVKLLRKNPAESYLFVPEDIVKPRPFIKKLCEQSDPLSRFLWEHFPNPTRQILSDPHATLPQQRAAIAKELNQFAKNGLLYTEDRFVEIKLPPEVKLAVASQAGSCLFTSNDFLDISSFVVKLSTHTEPFFQLLWNQCTDAERKVIENAATNTRQQESTLMEALLTRLNTILRGGCIYNPQCFEKIEISPEVLSLLTEAPQGEELVRLNRLLMEDACPQEIKKTTYNPHDKMVLRLNRRLLECAYPREIKRHDEYQTIMVDMERIIDKAELDKDPLIEPDDLIMVPERWINF